MEAFFGFLASTLFSSSSRKFSLDADSFFSMISFCSDQGSEMQALTELSPDQNLANYAAKKSELKEIGAKWVKYDDAKALDLLYLLLLLYSLLVFLSSQT